MYQPTNMRRVQNKMPHGSVSYLNDGRATGPENLYVNDTVRAQFQVVAVGIVHMAFADMEGNNCDPPAGIEVLKDGAQPVEPAVTTSGINGFFMSWDHGYTIVMDGVVLFTLRKQKQHSITPTPRALVIRARAMTLATQAVAAEAAAVDATIQPLATALAGIDISYSRIKNKIEPLC